MVVGQFETGIGYVALIVGVELWQGETFHEVGNGDKAKRATSLQDDPNGRDVCDRGIECFTWLVLGSS